MGAGTLYWSVILFNWKQLTFCVFYDVCVMSFLFDSLINDFLIEHVPQSKQLYPIKSKLATATFFFQLKLYTIFCLNFKVAATIFRFATGSFSSIFRETCDFECRRWAFDHKILQSLSHEFMHPIHQFSVATFYSLCHHTLITETLSVWLHSSFFFKRHFTASSKAQAHDPNKSIQLMLIIGIDDLFN